MGGRIVKFKVCPKENEQIEATIKIGSDKRSVIHGVVVNHCNKPVKDAVVKLLIMEDPKDPSELCPITHAFTDEFGQFLFGPLCPNKCYVIKVWYNEVCIRPIVVNPDPCDDECLDCPDCNECPKGQECHN